MWQRANSQARSGFATRLTTRGAELAQLLVVVALSVGLGKLGLGMDVRGIHGRCSQAVRFCVGFGQELHEVCWAFMLIKLLL